MFELASTPRDLGEILLQGLALGRLAFRRLFILTSVMAFLGIVPTACLVWGAGDISMDMDHMMQGLRGNYGRVGFLVLVLALPIRAILLQRVAAAARGQTYSLTEELRKALRLWPWMFVAGLIYIAAVCVGLVLLVVPGAILALTLMFEEFGLVLEGQGPIEALNVSHNRVWGHWWRTLGLLLLMFVPLGVLLGIMSAVLGIDPGSATLAVTGRNLFAQTVLEMVFAAVFGPFIYCVLYVYYHDLKLRKQNA